MEEDDWFGGDNSCCFCVPMNMGVRFIGMFWAINLMGLVIQIHNVTDDGSSKHQNANDQFYYVSYMFMVPIVFGIFRFMRFAV